MAKSKSKFAHKKDPKLPAALVKRATAAAQEKKARLLGEADELIALVRDKQTEIAGAFYDMGVALRRLRAPEMLHALGHKTFAELCKKRLAFSATVGERLIQIVDRLPRSRALSMGQSKALAMVSLAEATPEADTPQELYDRKNIRLPDGTKIDPRTASGKSIERAAKQIRQAAKPTGPKRGRTTTAPERATAKALEAALKKAGLARVTVTAVATKPGQASDLRIEHLPVDALLILKKALASMR